MESSNSDTTLEKILTEMAHIPAGKFQMGSKKRAGAHPVHTVYLDDFWIDIYEVTNAQFKAFVDANPEWSKNKIQREYHNDNYLKLWNGDDFPNGKADHPVVYVSWYAAMAYAQWVGKRLPTEAEWEKAARGGAVGRRYVWGDSPDPTKSNYISHGNSEYTSSVGSYPPNGFGLYDMGGNVWELCLDEYDAKFYRRSPDKNPIAGAADIETLIENFMDVRTQRVARGGSWTTPGPAHTADRGNDPPNNTNGWLGFRCAKTMTAQEKEELSKLNADKARNSSRQPSKVAFDSEEAFQQVADNSRDAVVYIESFASTIFTLPWRIHKALTKSHSATYSNLHRRISRMPEDLQKIFVGGTGFFIAPDMLVTNIHVVARAKTVAAKQMMSEEIVLYTIEGVTAFDEKNDLVVLKVAEKCVTPLRLGDSGGIQSEERVCTITYAETEYKYIKGTISNSGTSDKFHRIKTQLSPGDSGSPVLNNSGEVIGVADSIIKSAKDSTIASESAIAISSNVLKSLLEKMDGFESLAAWQKRPYIRAYAACFRGDRILQRQKYKKAIAKYNVALKLNPDMLLTYVNRGTARFRLDDFEGAIADYDAALQINPNLLSAYSNRAIAKMSMYDLDGASEDINFVFQHFADLTPVPHLYYIRAAVKGSLGDLLGAIEDIDKSITVNPKFAEAYTMRCMIKTELKDYKEAIDDAQKTIQLNSKSEMGYTGLSGAKRVLGKSKADQGEIVEAQRLYQEAIDDAEKAIQIKSKSHLAIFERGRAKQHLAESKANQGNIEEAQELYNAAIVDHSNAIKIKPKSPTAYNGRGWTKYQLGQLETEHGNVSKGQKLFQAAEVDSSEAIRISKSSYYAYYYFHTRGAAKAALGDYDKAIEDFSEAIRINSSHGLSYRDRGKAKEALGQMDAANADYEKAKELEAKG